MDDAAYARWLARLEVEGDEAWLPGERSVEAHEARTGHALDDPLPAFRAAADDPQWCEPLEFSQADWDGLFAAARAGRPTSSESALVPVGRQMEAHRAAG